MLSFDGQYKKCLKCGHQRTAQDKGPDWACPACDAVYAKVEAMMAARAAIDAEEADARRMRDAERVERAARGASRGRAMQGEGDGDVRKGYAQLGYLLLAMPFLASIIVGAVGGQRGSAGWPMLCSVLGVVLAHVMLHPRDESWVDTHFRWQIKTFWRMFGWAIGLAVLLGVFIAMTRGRAEGLAILIGLCYLGIGLLYFIRVVRGWIKLNRGDEIGA